MHTTNLSPGRCGFLAVAALAALSTTAIAQHEQHVPRVAVDTPMAMSMSGPLGIPMERMGSGTTWIPDAVVLPSRHFVAGNWMLMVHGFLFGQYDWQEGPRGADQWGSLNWAMLMADRPLGGGRLQLRFMPSLDPWTVTRCGYPLLLQSGETCHGQPNVDRQHPHDFFMELGVLYEREITSHSAMLLYVAPAGEPALGPVAFMHRPSAMDEPQAPLGHHWQDATHISFGVITAGIFTREVRVEVSAFNGTEPDESRWNIDPIQLNSMSGRLTVNPQTNWSFTVGYGRLANPERAVPAEPVNRFVVSLLHGRRLGQEGQWASTLLLGSNREHEHRPTHSLLLESEAVLDRRNTVFGRIEQLRKGAHHLGLPSSPEDRGVDIAAISLGYVRELSRGAGMTLGLGARGTVNFVPPELQSAYGSRTPVGGMIFLRLRPFHDRSHEGNTHDAHGHPAP
jgi:hypothetical protein